MPLYKNNKICLIHIPKCGGTSFTNAMRNNLKDEVSYYDNRFKSSNEKDHSPQHSTYLELKNIIPNDYEIIAFLRDPYERFLSEYKWRIKGGQIKKNIGQDEFAKKLFTSKEWWDNHNKPQKYFIDGGLDVIKMIKVNDMNKYFVDKFGINIDIKNKTHSGPDKISDIAKKFVDQCWNEDFDLFKKL